MELEIHHFVSSFRGGEMVQTACLGFGAVLQLDFLQPRMWQSGRSQLVKETGWLQNLGLMTLLLLSISFGVVIVRNCNQSMCVCTYVSSSRLVVLSREQGDHVRLFVENMVTTAGSSGAMSVLIQ
jgi:hypothetical protein